MKMQKANCGASVKASGGKKPVKAAMGGYMKVEKTGYSTGGMAEKQVSRKSDTKDKEMVEASKGGAMKKKPAGYAKGGTPMATCAGCPTPKACSSAGRCKKSGNKLK